MKKKLKVVSYGDNNSRGTQGEPDHEREPLVHLLYSDEWGELQSMSFPPGQAPIIAAAILRAGVNAGKDVDGEHLIEWEDGS